ncbi:MAG: ABC transporter [Acidobacteria bacterium]|nr:MAG: ABC transporter [Acidobacteriota bacterium]
MEHIVSVENLSKDYETGFWKKKKVRALDGLSLSVSEGQIFGFLGGNGAGKTTTIKLLMRLLYPTEGSASILGQPIDSVSMHRQIGYCPENPYFYDYLTPVELFDYFGRLFDLDASKRKAKTGELLTKVGLEERDWKKQLRKFSKGMLQRVGLAQSLINEPRIVFLDEPMSGLDPIGRREIRELIAELPSKGTAVFMSTHILSDAEALCDEVAILSRGKLAAAGKLHDLLAESNDQPRFEIVVAGADAAKLRISIPNATEIEQRSGDTLVIANRDSDIEGILRAARDAGGSLISINPIRRSLEDLFVAQTKTD